MAKGKIAALSTPKSGGALRGLGEKFAPDLFTGTGNFSIPIGVPEGRPGLTPSLSLSYSTGQGNGLFGLGWSLSIPGVSRSTIHGLCTYDDAVDTFVLSGLEDLVPLPRNAKDDPVPYRPRTEGSFARILHIDTKAEGNFWKVESKDGLISHYGTPRAHLGSPPAGWIDEAALYDPDEPSKIFTWNLTRTEDPFKNRIEYVYTRDVGRDEPRAWNTPLLKEIRYLDYGSAAAPEFLARIVFDWEARPDPFSAYRASFEVRTTQRCRSITVEMNGKPQKEFSFRYGQARNGVSLLREVQVTGIDASGLREKLAPLSLDYSTFDPEQQTFETVSIPNLPPGALLLPVFALVDATGNGLPDVVELSGAQPRIFENLGEGRFDVPVPMRDAPTGVSLGGPGVSLMDTTGNGRQDLAILSGTDAGVYPMRADGKWDRRTFRRYPVAPSFNLVDPEVHLLDLDGDGAVDALRAGLSSLDCFFQDRRLGWREVRSFPRRGLNDFPNVSFSDPRVRFADMSGDGLQDIVLIHQGRVEYWPACGRGEWGKRLEMQNPPRLPERFDARRLVLGDVDGDGCADLLFVSDHGVTLWLNQSGERFSEPIYFEGTPPLNSEDSVRLIDLYGVGTQGLLFIASAGSSARSPLYFLDLSGRVKPYLLNQIDNHIGTQTRVSYASSTKFALRDWQDGQRWLTPLPFPVQVVERTEVLDTISETRLTTEFSYHHGYWDGEEREFRGFGRVHQRDTERMRDSRQRTFGETVPEIYFSPPSETRTWFHQGAIGDESSGWEESDYRSEFWAEDPSVLVRSEAERSELAGLLPKVRRDALRALRGRVLRTELYALDGSPRQSRPYTVTETLHGVSGLPGASTDLRALPEDDWRVKVLFPYQIAQRTSQWERGSEPQVSFQYTGAYDAYGQAREQIAIAVPRSRALSHQEEATDAAQFLATLTRTAFAYSVSAGIHITDRVARARTFEIVNSGKVSVPALHKTAAELSAKLEAGPVPSGLRLLSEERSYYDGDAFIGLPLGQVGSYGMLVRTAQLALDEQQLEAAYGSRDKIPRIFPIAENAADTDHKTWPAEYWSYVENNASFRKEGTAFFADVVRAKYDFHLPVDPDPKKRARGNVLESKDARERTTKAEYDASYALYPVAVTDPAGLLSTADYDWHFLQPKQTTDPNGNSTEVELSPLGMVKKRYLRSKVTTEGDKTLPSEEYSYQLTSAPIWQKVRKRQYHDTDTDTAPDIEAITYSDGFGRMVQTRTQAETLSYGNKQLGEVLTPDVTDNSIVTEDLEPKTDPNRVVISEWKRYDNKGRIVETAEPYFGSGFALTPPAKEGAVSSTFYDPLGRVQRSLSGDGSMTLTVRGVLPIGGTLSKPDDFLPSPWEVYTYDANDNAGRDGISGDRDLLLGRAQRSLFSAHQDTPSNIELDALGRTLFSIQRPSTVPASWQRTEFQYDLVGNILALIDPLGRLVTGSIYDYVKRPLMTRSLDAGTHWVLHDAGGSAVFKKDERQALTLHKEDPAGRAAWTWTRDGELEPIVLRTLLVYGDQQIPDDATRAARRARNQLGRLFTQRDGAGLLKFERYDFRGNLTLRVRRVIKDTELLKSFDGDPWKKATKIVPYRIDWTGTPPKSDADLDSIEYTTEAGFDALNRPKWLQYPVPSGAGPKLYPRYNLAGAITQLKLDGTTLIEHISYNAKGQRVLVISACTKTPGSIDKRILTRYAFDSRVYRLVRSRSEVCTYTAHKITPQGQPIQDTGYLYDRAGNLWHALERCKDCGVAGDRDQLDRLFTYDALYRLVSATGRETELQIPPAAGEELWDSGPWSTDLSKANKYAETYSYDAAGYMSELKRTSELGAGMTRVHLRTYQGFSATTDPKGPRKHNRLKLVSYADGGGGTTNKEYTYDESGNCLSEDTSRGYEWDHAGRLRSFRVQANSASEPSQYAQYLYDAAGERVKKLIRKQGVDSWESITYIDGVLEHRIQQSGATTEEGHVLHVLDGRRRIGRRRSGKQPDSKPSLLLVLDDHLGNANLELDWSDGGFVEREEFRPFGETSFGSYSHKGYRFTGKERDEESGLTYHGARYYAAWLGRWVSPDPAGPVDATSLYVYVGGKPMQQHDPTGRAGEQAPAAQAPAGQAPAQPPAAQPPAAANKAAPKAAQPRLTAAERSTQKQNLANEYSQWQRDSAAGSVGRAQGFVDYLRGKQQSLSKDTGVTIPLSFLLGWIEKETSSRVGLDTDHSGKDEIGLFQISKEERGFIGYNKPGNEKNKTQSDHNKLLHDQQYSIDAGVKMIKYYINRLTTEEKYGLKKDTPALLELTRLMHQQGTGQVAFEIQQLRKAGINPETVTWDQIMKLAEDKAMHGRRPAVPVIRLDRVPLMWQQGREMDRRLTPPPPQQPK